MADKSRTHRLLRTEAIDDVSEVRAFFDRLAEHYVEFHGDKERLLRYRLRIIKNLLKGSRTGALLEIGCGTGLHLVEFSQDFGSLIGVDLSPKMIDTAKAARKNHSASERIRFAVDSADALTTIDDNNVNAVLCVGALEHMLNKDAVFREVRRVLKPEGIFVCLTPNGNYIWYTHLAPWLNYDTKHLSTDQFLTRNQLSRLIEQTGLKTDRWGYWRFIPRGDMPGWIAALLFAVDVAGLIFNFSRLRGGLYFKAVKN